VIPENYGGAERQDPDGLHLCFVGRLTPIKGVRVLLDAFDAARQAVPGCG
jgi:glycosyltransferase involved in cell wall biosynthesis